MSRFSWHSQIRRRPAVVTAILLTLAASYMNLDGRGAARVRAGAGEKRPGAGRNRSSCQSHARTERGEVMRVYLLAAAAGIAAAALAADGPTDKELRKKPVTTAEGELGDLLRAWYKHDMAAGNVGDWYDNRDREHSPLALATYPQLRKVAYSDEDRKAGLDWAWQRRVLPHVVFGNSSTSATAATSGSNPRSFYCFGENLRILEQQYLKNTLYVYPEHQDHDPGHNGLGGGYGDLFPTNTPYLLISQGSSGSDQPFLRVLPTVLASFRPDVKKKLVETGLLMPTVQMVLRSSSNHFKGP